MRLLMPRIHFHVFVNVCVHVCMCVFLCVCLCGWVSGCGFVYVCVRVYVDICISYQLMCQTVGRMYACVHMTNVKHVYMRPVQTFGKPTLPTLKPQS